MVNLSQQLVSRSEANLIEVIRQIGYGELFGVEIEPGGKVLLSDPLTPAMCDFLEYIRAGCAYIDVLTVQNGQPVLAETDLEIQGVRCRKKVKFPTRKLEG